jgi:hypothetical protein
MLNLFCKKENIDLCLCHLGVCRTCKTEFSALMAFLIGIPLPDLYVAFKIIYVYDYIRVNKLHKKQTKCIQNHLNPNLLAIGHGEAIHENYKKFQVVGGQAHDHSVD